jgi:hypothetical protein
MRLPVRVAARGRRHTSPPPPLAGYMEEEHGSEGRERERDREERPWRSERRSEGEPKP